jgi:hypothetical protein
MRCSRRAERCACALEQTSCLRLSCCLCHPVGACVEPCRQMLCSDCHLTSLSLNQQAEAMADKLHRDSEKMHSALAYFKEGLLTLNQQIPSSEVSAPACLNVASLG